MQTTISSPILQTSNDDRAPKSYRRIRDLADRIESNVSRFLAIVAPNPDDYHGTWKSGQKPTLYGEFVDSQGKRKWDVLRDADPIAALDAHAKAGMRQEPVAVQDNAQGPIRSIALRYDFDAMTEYVSVDLDGGYPAVEVVARLKNFFGPGSILPHSGSGTEGRYRVLIRLSKPMTVLDMQSHMHAICVYIGFPIKGGHLEISPGNAPSRTPFAFGGCQLFSLDLEKIGEPDFDAAVSAFLHLTPIDLEKLSSELEKDRIDPAIRSVNGKYDPLIRVERSRSRPRAMRRLISEGITGFGQRIRAIYLFVRDCLFSGYYWHQAVERLVAWIEAGKLDASRDIQRNGRQWQIAQVVGIVLKLYATIPPLGIPDPIPLTSEEIREVKQIANEVSSRSDYSFSEVERFLLRALPWFKGAHAAGLPMLRMHCKRWESFSRHYVELRHLVGLFVAETSYRSLTSVRARRSQGARDCEAHARSYSCRFAFRLSKNDVPSYVLSTQGKRIVSSVDMPMDPPNVFVCNFPSTPTNDLPLSSVSSSLPPSPTRTPQLYVPHSPISFETRDLDRVTSDDKTQEQGIDTSQPTNPNPTTSPDATSRRRKRPAKGSDRLRRTQEPPTKPKVPEWQLLNRWSAPGAEHMELDEWLDATAALPKEYAREKRRAEADRKDLERQHGIRTSLGKVASKRFHELREIFGFKPWN